MPVAQAIDLEAAELAANRDDQHVRIAFGRTGLAPQGAAPVDDRQRAVAQAPGRGRRRRAQWRRARR